MWPDVSPFFQRARRERLKYQASPRRDGAGECLSVHVRDHQDFARTRVGGDASHQAVGVEFGRQSQALLQVGGGAGWRE